MGWKGTVRSVGAAIRAAERGAKRRQRELERQHKQYEKMQELEQAAYEVDVYENHIEVIQSIHKESSESIDWNTVVSTEKPTKPSHTRNNEDKALIKLETYRPGFIDRLFNRENKKKELLALDLANAIKKDEAEYANNISIWEKAVAEWQEEIDVANKLLKGDAQTKIKVIEKLQPFSEISNLGSRITVMIKDNGLLEATVNIHGKDIVPNEIKSLLRSGKLSVKNMPKSRFNEIYQDYVCSCALRVANELFSILPDEIMTVTAVDDLLNTKTGYLEETAILSVAIPKTTLKKLNLQMIDPSDAMSNFVHNMSFQKTKGFEPVERVDANQLNFA